MKHIGFNKKIKETKKWKENQAKKSGPQTSADTAAIFERALNVGRGRRIAMQEQRKSRASSMNPESRSR